MVRPVRKRRADPLRVQQLWAAVSFIRQQKQIPNLERVCRYMQRVHEVEAAEVEMQLQLCVKDNLIKEYLAVGCKGVRVGVEQDGYKLPSLDEEWDRGDHDWYCFDCHQPGEVIECSDCWRVVHPTCTEEDWTGDKFTCSVCKTSKRKPRIKRKELNRLLGYTLARIKANLKTKELHRFGTSNEDQLKVDRLVYRYMDLNLMEDRTNERKYKYLDQFYADCRTILHNVFICFGDVSVMAELAKIMMKDCKYDIEEIRQCKDCYHYSNAKPKDWFCQPCRPPHKLVYAKQKGFSYWPAKVIKVTKEGYDVRFFGGYHQRVLFLQTDVKAFNNGNLVLVCRAYIPESSVKPIETNLKTLNAKRTAGFVKATRELAWHQELLEKAAKNGLEEGLGAEGASEPEEEEDPGLESPEIRHKKFRKASHTTSSSSSMSHRRTPLFQDYEFTDVSSSSLQDKAAPTPEDVNIVTSSGDNYPCQRTFSTSDIGVQTSKKLLGKTSPKSTQTDLESGLSIATTSEASSSSSSSSGSCNCEAKFNKALEDYKTQLEAEMNARKERTAVEIEDRLQSEFEEDKQQAVSRAVASVQREVEKARRQAEEQAKTYYTQELKKLAIKHKAEQSATKKKQWCYNCEKEAMYHCCWNTSYCSIKCQQEHWHGEHKGTCRRKRN